MESKAQFSLFGPEMWATLATNPDTAPLLADSEFVDIIQQLQKDPAKLGEFIQNPKLMKALSVLASASASAFPSHPTAPTAKQPKSNGVERETEEDLSGLTDDERNKKLAEREKEKGNKAYKDRDLKTAIECYTKAFELDPKNISYLTNRAAAKFESEDIDGCVTDAQLAIEKNIAENLHADFKLIARAYQRIAAARLKQGDLDEAIAQYEKSLLEFNDPKVHEKVLELKRQKKKKDEEAYINPELSKAEREKGNQFFREGKFPDALKCYTEAIKRNPNDPAPYSNRAAAYTKLGEFPLGLKDCDKCLELDPKYAKAYSRKGAIHFFMKEYHKCMEAYQKGLEIDPNNEEMKDGLRRTMMAIREQQSAGVDEEQVKHAMADPEIQKIMMDPGVQQALKEMTEDPKASARVLSNKEMAAKINKLIAAGIVRVA